MTPGAVHVIAYPCAGPSTPETMTSPVSPNDRNRWDERYREGDWCDIGEPARIVREAEPWLPVRGRALDLACGAGRNALFLGRRGLDTLAVDVSGEGLRLLSRRARAEALPVRPVQADLERFALREDARFEVVVNVRFLLRSLLPRIRRWLAPGGVLIFETFNVDEIEILGGDIRRAFALERGELRRAFAGLEVLAYEEGIFERPEGARGLAGMIARRPARGEETGIPSG